MHAKVQSIPLFDSERQIQVGCHSTIGQGNWTRTIQSFVNISRKCLEIILVGHSWKMTDEKRLYDS